MRCRSDTIFSTDFLFTGIVVRQSCAFDDEVPIDQRDKRNFCGPFKEFEICACDEDDCNHEKCNCETKPKEEKTMEPEPEDETEGSKSVEPEETATSKPTKPPGKTSQTKAKSKSTKPTGTKEAESTKPSKTAKQTLESISAPKQNEPEKQEEVDNRSNMVVVDWEYFFVCACIFAFQFLYKISFASHLLVSLVYCLNFFVCSTN